MHAIRTAFTAALLLYACVAQAGDNAADQWLKKGDGQWAAGHPELAMKSFAEAEKAAPDSTRVLMKMAGLQLATQHFEDAIDTYHRVIGLDPRNAKAFIGMAIAYLHDGGYDLAKAAFEQALRIEPQRKVEIDPVLANLEEMLPKQ